MNTIWDITSMRRARTDAGLTIKAAAVSINITPEYLSMVENGHKQPSQRLIGRMSEIYKVPISYFLQEIRGLAKTK